MIAVLAVACMATSHAHQFAAVSQPIPDRQAIVCRAVKQEEDSEIKRCNAVVTGYWAQGEDVDHDTANHRTSTGVKARQGITVAVDPNIIPYGSRVTIPGLGTFIAQDTGSAVRRRIAARARGDRKTHV